MNDVGSLIERGAGSEPSELQYLLEMHGHVLVRGVLDVAALRAVHRQFCNAAVDAGWTLEDGSDDVAPLARVERACASPEAAYIRPYHRLYRSEALHRIPHWPELTSLMGAVLDADIVAHPRLVGRLIFPRSPDVTTPPHQDNFQVQGTPDAVTCWIPLHDCPEEAGGLMVADRSHRDGLLAVEPSMGASGATVRDAGRLRWLTANYARGDVLLFHGLTVHRGGPNVTDRLRFSVDVRYQRRSDPICWLSLEFGPRSDLSWHSIYRDWASTELQYYWRALDLKVVEYDRTKVDELECAAFERGFAGDRVAVAALQRVAAHSTDPDKRQAATELLEHLGAPLGTLRPTPP